MERKIVLFAREFLTVGTDLDPKTAKYIDVQRELHKEVDRELRTYGVVDRQRTSGTMLRVDTPSSGVHRAALELPEDAQKTAAANAFPRACAQIDQAQFVVFIRDAYSDTRGALVMYAHLKNKRILALQQTNPSLKAQIEAVYLLRGIENVEFKNSDELKLAIRRYFNNFPLASAAG